MENTFFTPGLQLMENHLNSQPSANTIIKYKFSGAFLNIPITDLRFSNIYPIYLVSNVELTDVFMSISNSGDEMVPLKEKAIFNYPLDFCTYLHNQIELNKIAKFRKQTGKYVYKIPWKQFGMKSIVGPAIKGSQGIFFQILEKSNSGIQLSDPSAECYMYMENEDLKAENQIEYELSKLTTPIIDIHHFSDKLKKSNSIMSFSSNYHYKVFSNTAKGIFFEDFDIDKIARIKLVLDGVDRINYDQEMLKLFLQKINHKLYYLSFDNLHYLDWNWKNAVDFNDYDKVELYIESAIWNNIDETTEQTMSYYFLSYNNLVYNSGNCRKKYSRPGSKPLENNLIDTNEYEHIKECDINICPVCRDVQANVITKCYHQYCQECLEVMYKANINIKCPLCTELINKGNKRIKIIT